MDEVKRAEELHRMIKKMSSIDKDRTLLAFMLLNSSIIGKLDQINGELATLGVEDILNNLGQDFRTKHKI
jgi:hypothetical protein